MSNDAFQPHVYRLTERKLPSSLTLFALSDGVNRWLKIPLPADLPNRSQEEQAKAVRDAVVNRGLERQDTVEKFMGAITGYLYRPTAESSYRVSPDGELDPEDQGPFKEPRIGAGLG